MVSSPFLAGVLVGIAAAFAAVALRQRKRPPLPRPYLLGAAFVAAAVIAAGIIYHSAGSHSLSAHSTANAAPGAGPAQSMQAAVASLEARLARAGGSDADWTLLAQAYD